MWIMLTNLQLRLASDVSKLIKLRNNTICLSGEKSCQSCQLLPWKVQNWYTTKNLESKLVGNTDKLRPRKNCLSFEFIKETKILLHTIWCKSFVHSNEKLLRTFCVVSIISRKMWWRLRYDGVGSSSNK